MAETKSKEHLKVLYDAACKNVLSEKGIVAHILKTCAEEYKDSTIEEIIQCIQGKPEIDKILVQDLLERGQVLVRAISIKLLMDLCILLDS